MHPLFVNISKCGIHMHITKPLRIKILINMAQASAIQCWVFSVNASSGNKRYTIFTDIQYAEVVKPHSEKCFVTKTLVVVILLLHFIALKGFYPSSETASCTFNSILNSLQQYYSIYENSSSTSFAWIPVQKQTYSVQTWKFYVGFEYFCQRNTYLMRRESFRFPIKQLQMCCLQSMLYTVGLLPHFRSFNMLRLQEWILHPS